MIESAVDKKTYWKYSQIVGLPTENDHINGVIKGYPVRLVSFGAIQEYDDNGVRI